MECTVCDLSELLEEVCDCLGANLFAVEVPRSHYIGGHVTSAGISKTRVGNECRPRYTAEDDQTNAPVPDATFEDLSLTSIRWAMGEHVRRFSRPTATWSDTAEFLMQPRLLDPFLVAGEVTPRYRVRLAGLLLFGKENVVSRRVPFFETIVKTGSGVHRIRKNIVESVRELALGEASIIRQHCPRLEPVVLQELLVNAYVHRCWRTAAPVVINLVGEEIEIQNPGDLLPGLHVENLIYCVPAYRNLALAEGARFIGLCDKIGQGIDLVFASVLSGGFDFPIFESSANCFTARVPLKRSDEFCEFVRKRSQTLTNLDQIVALRFLWANDEGTLPDLCRAMQRSEQGARRVLTEMVKKLMVEPADQQGFAFRLTHNVRSDIEAVGQSNQLSLGLFGDG